VTQKEQAIQRGGKTFLKLFENKNNVKENSRD